MVNTFEREVIIPMKDPAKHIQASKDYFKLMQEICGANQEALLFVHQVVEAALHFDHVADSDPIDQAMASRTLEAMCIHWPLNSFLRNHAPALVAVISQAIEKWRNDDDHYSIYNNIAAAVCLILHGQKGVDEYMPRVRYIVRKGQMEDDALDE